MISDKMKLQTKNCDAYSVFPDFKGKTMNIEIVNMCNEKCIYCEYSAQGLHRQGGFIDDELFYKVTKEAKELGITDVGLYITGEPFLNPLLDKYIYYLKKELKFDYVYLSTNGILCTSDNLIKVVEAGIDSIKFSVSSSERENFKKHHGVDAFDKVLDNIKFAYKYREENQLDYALYMFCIITRYNEHEKEKMKELYEKYVDEIVCLNVISSPYVKGVRELLGTQMREAGLTEIICMENLTLPCEELFNKIVVNAEGYLCVCCHETRSGYTCVENLHEISLKDAVYGEKMKKIRQMHIDKKICGTICEDCISGSIHEIVPFEQKLCNKGTRISVVEVSEEIKRRFQ